MFIRMRLGKRLRIMLESTDVLQETYQAACQDIDRFEGTSEDELVAWMCRIAENRIRGLADHHGVQKRRPQGALLPVERVLEVARQSGTGPVTGAARLEP